jgi:hypothetical protein
MAQRLAGRLPERRRRPAVIVAAILRTPDRPGGPSCLFRTEPADRTSARQPGDRVMLKRSALALAAVLASLIETPAFASLDNDPFVYDPSFNYGVVLEDRFASPTTASYLLGLRIARADNGDLIAAGIVPAAYASAPPANNLGLVRYGPHGERLAWSAPSSQFVFFEDRYVDYPNSTSGNIGWVEDLKMINGRIYALTDSGGAQRDVRIAIFSDGGAFIDDMPAFTTGLDEVGAALIPYTYPTFDGSGNPITQQMLIAVATYATSIGRQIITMKRFVVSPLDGSLAVDSSFGISNNGAMDQPLPDSFCDAGANCSWFVTDGVAVRDTTNAPTLYLTGTVMTSGSESDAFVAAIDGYDGRMAGTFGHGDGIYVNYLEGSSYGVSVAVAPAADAANDVVYLASNTAESCGQKGAVTKLRAEVTLPEGTMTLPDFFWGDGGTRDIGGNPGSCGNVFTYLTRVVLDGDRLAFSGYESLVSTIPDPLFSVVRVSDGALTEFARAGFTPMRADGTPWGGAIFTDLVATGSGRYATTGFLYDDAAGDALLFGTAQLVSDRIFADGF